MPNSGVNEYLEMRSVVPIGWHSASWIGVRERMLPYWIWRIIIPSRCDEVLSIAIVEDLDKTS